MLHNVRDCGALFPGGRDPWFSNDASTLTRVGKATFLLIVSAYFALCFGSHTSFLNLEAYTRGAAATPYQYRILPMFIFRGLIHSSLLLRAAQHAEPLHRDPYYVILTGIAFVCMLAATWVTQLTVAELTGDEVFAFWAAFLVPFMGLLELASSFGLMYSLPYDVPALLFFTLSMYLIISGRRWWFYALFPIAVLNRETACFATVFFAIWEWVRLSERGVAARVRLQRILPVAVVQALLWLAIKIVLLRHFSHNATESNMHAGGLFTSKISYNLREVLKPQQWPVLLSICGFSLPFLYAQRRWIKRDGLFWACAIILPIYFLSMMIVGVIVEIRIFTEWIALVAPTLALIVHNRFRPLQA